MRIEEEIKLDYSDVLFRPKRSTLKSRKEVDLSRTYKFKYSNNEWTGVPIIASNMDGVGELGVANILSKFNMLTALTKQHDLKKISDNPNVKEIFNSLLFLERIKSKQKKTFYFRFSRWPRNRQNYSHINCHNYINKIF